MGVWADRWGAAFETRNDTGWLTRDDGEEAYGAKTASGVSVNARVALGLTTVWRCIDLLTSAVSQAPKDINIRIGNASFVEYTKPSWLVTPNPTDPTYTANDYFAQVALSLLVDGNYFVRVVPDVFNPIGLLVLPPSRVVVRAGPLYDILDSAGKVIATLNPYEMLHGTWIRPPGELRGISPLETLRRGIGSAVAAEDHAARFFGQGAALAFGVEVPYAMDPTKLNNLRESLKAKYAGARNSHAIGVLADGGKFVPGLAPSPEQAQMLETRKFSVEDLCRPYGVPPAMAGSTEPGAASFASTDSYDSWFKERAVLPLASRIESQHDRLVQVPATVTDPRASAQFRFNLDAVARVNLLARSQAYREQVTGGTLTPNEARAYEDRPPIDGGDVLYMQQQMVPISLLGQTKATEPLDTQPAPAGAPRSISDEAYGESRAQLDSAVEILSTVQSARAMADSGMTMMEGLNALSRQIAAIPAPIVNLPAPIVNVEAPIIPAPIVNVEAPIVNVPAPVVNVESPIVDTSPISRVVAALGQQRTVKTVRRDATGRISAVIEEPTR